MDYLNALNDYRSHIFPTDVLIFGKCSGYFITQQDQVSELNIVRMTGGTTTSVLLLLKKKSFLKEFVANKYYFTYICETPLKNYRKI